MGKAMNKTMKVDELVVEGVTYVPKNTIPALAKSDGLPWVMIRTYAAGVHYGQLKKRESTLAGIEVTLVNARRVWRWEGAASLSELAARGTSNPKGCKFPMEVPEIELVAIEVIKMTQTALDSLNTVEVWTE